MIGRVFFVRTYLHLSGFVNVCISPVLFATNGLNCRLYPFIHHENTGTVSPKYDEFSINV